jgi:hypothetical protein
VLLIGALALTLALALFFGGRLFWRFRNRPDRQPIRAWMSIPQVGRSYGIPPPELYRTLGLEVPPPGDRRPITDLATQTGKSETEIITALETRVAQPLREPRGPDRKDDPASPKQGPKGP